MPRMNPVVNFRRPDGSFGSLFVGATQDIRTDEAGIQTALAEARDQGGTEVRISFINSEGRCLHRVWIKA